MLHFVHHLLLRVERLLLEPKGFPNSLTELEGGLVVQQFFSNDKTIFSFSEVLHFNGYNAIKCLHELLN